MAAKKIIVFIGSTRDGRFGERVSRFVSNLLRKHSLEPIIFDPLKMPFEILKQPLHFMPDPTKAPQWLQEANEQIKTADGFLVVSPEYNCSLPPALTNMIDHFPPPSYQHRPCAICVYSMGPFGGIRAAALLRPFLSEVGIVTTPFAFVIPTVKDKFDELGTPLEDRMFQNGEKLIKELQWYASAIKDQKEKSGSL